MTAITNELEDRLLRAVHDASTDVVLLAHEVARSDHAQRYLVELVSTLSAVSSTSSGAARAEALLERGLAILAAHEDAEAQRRRPRRSSS